MTDNFKYRNLPAFVFAFAVLLMQGCSFNFSAGGAEQITDSEAEAIAIKTLKSFSRAVEKGNFEQFDQTEVAPSFKNDLTTEKFNTAFAQFITDRIDIKLKDGAHINWSPKPAIDGKFLNLNGSYSAQSGKTVNFKLQYVKDTTDWNLKYIDIHIN